MILWRKLEEKGERNYKSVSAVDSQLDRKQKKLRNSIIGLPHSPLSFHSLKVNQVWGGRKTNLIECNSVSDTKYIESS